MSVEVQTLRHVLVNAANFAWSDALFADRTSTWSLDTVCLVHDPDDVETDDPDAFIVMPSRD